MNTRIILTTTLLAATLAFAAGGKTPPKFYAYCVEVGVPGLKPRPLAGQAKLLRELGYDGIGWPLPLGDDLGANLKLLDDAGLRVFMFWTSVNVSPAKAAPCDPGLLAAIAAHQRPANSPNKLIPNPPC